MQPRNYQDIASIVDSLSESQMRFGMTILDHSMHGKHLASVIASVSRVDEDQIRDKMLEMSEGVATVIPNSVREIDSKRLPTVRFFSVANVQTMDFNSENMQRLVKINANVFADEETNSIWELNSNGESQYLVQKSSDDLDELFESRKSRISSRERDGHVTHASGDFVAYATSAGRVDVGLYYESESGNHVFDYDRRCRVDIEPGQIVCSALFSDEIEQVNMNEFTANISSKQGTAILDYFRKLYGSNQAFFNRLTQLVKDFDGKVKVVETNPDVNDMIRNVVTRH